MPRLNDSPDAGVDRAVTAALRELSWTVHRRPPQRNSAGPLNTTAIAMLKQVVDAPGSTVGELAAELALRQSNASAAVRLLVQHGYVERRPDLEDRRVVRIMPTERGVREEQVVAAAWAGSLDEAFAGLPAQRQQELRSALVALREIERRLRGIARVTS
ncbi:MarR family winged helix-turn-helix transcriptional regulator [Microbacterium elymi]|uniref:MarR family winged helix-turn-helix transcriptional regulator n=1 Tax=Microbacterium elymi TaxID=2909587 RepID=A0ABY5NHX0_9MICO|nr:MarR family winged helix-turn-helix transcriptional regulator [Microbacterium elymi]UUT34789.1 MarR family winged helix-turn-helix transcriptional regulator [Microbacterium elymi]